MMKPSTFGFLVVRGVRNLGKHWAMTIACIASLSVCMTLNTFATLAEVNVDSMVNYLGQQNEMVVYVDPEADDATIQSVGGAHHCYPGREPGAVHVQGGRAQPVPWVYGGLRRSAGRI